MDKKNYSLKVYCKNCDFNGSIEIEKGKKLEDVECLMCGCEELEKKEKTLVRPEYKMPVQRYN